MGEEMYKIFLSEKFKKKSIRELFRIIDIFQSYNADWQTYFIDVDVDIGSAERLTSIPTNCGALLFREFYFSEERLMKIIGRRGFDKKYIEKFIGDGLKLERILSRREVERIIYGHPEIIDLANIEIYFPLTSKGNLKFLEKDLGELKFVIEVIETSYSYINPKAVEKILEESYFLGEYLEKLWKKYVNESIIVEKGYILLAKGIVDACTSLTQLETYIDRFIKNVNHRNISMMFNRIF